MAKARILLVADKPDEAKLSFRPLEDCGHAIVGIATSRDEAVQQAGTVDANLIIMSAPEGKGADAIADAVCIRDRYDVPLLLLASAEETSMLRRNGLMWPIECLAMPSDTGNLDAAIQAALWKHEAHHQVDQQCLDVADALTGTDDPMITVDADGRIKSMNPAAEKMTGWRQSEAMGKRLDEIVVVLDASTCAPQPNPVMEALCESETRYTTACCSLLSAKYGTRVPIYQSATPIRNEKGEISGVVWVFRNVTEQRTVEAEVVHRLTMEDAVTRVSRRFMSPEVVDLSKVLGILAEASRVNKAAIFRFDHEPLKARRICSWKDGAVTGDAAGDQTLDMSLYPWWQERLERGEDLMISDASALPDTARPEQAMLRGLAIRSLLSVPIYLTEGRLQGFMCFEKTCDTWEGIQEDARLLRMIAETIGTYWTYQRLQAALRESDKLAATGRMVARIAHEINNPLAGILHAFLLVKDGISSDHPHYAYVPLIEGEIERLASVVRQMLQLHAPRDEMSCPLSIGQVLEDVTALSTTFAEERDVTIRIEASDDIGPVMLPEGALRQVLMNLVRNAIEASPEGGVVRLEPRRTCDRLRVYVADDGPGVPSDIRSSIFEPFFTTKRGRQDSGLGLGLSISQGLAGFMRGSLELTSAPGQGAEFCLDVPIRKAEKE